MGMNLELGREYEILHFFPLRCGFMHRVSNTFSYALAFNSCSVSFRLASSRFGVRSALLSE